MLSLELTAMIACGFWALLSLDRRRSWPTAIRLPEKPTQDEGESLLSVVAIVPARNEAETLPETLPSLLHQSLEVVLVDDGSLDDTAAIAHGVAASLDRAHQLRVIKAAPAPEGWSGKVHALLSGYSSILERAEEIGEPPPEWLLLTDADIRHRSGSALSLLGLASEGDGFGPFDLVSIMARLRARGPWERLLIPAFVYFFQLLYPFRLVSHPRSRVAAAAGGCVLVRRRALEEAGGFAMIGREIIDDVALGRAIKGGGRRIWLGLDPGIASIRSYRRLGDLWRMVSRTAFTQLHHRWDLLLLTLAALAVLLISPPVVLGVALASAALDGLGGSGPLWRTVLWSGTAWALMFLAYLPAVRHHRVPIGFALTLPLAGLLFGLMTTDSAWEHLRGKGPSWKGRSYDSF